MAETFYQLNTRAYDKLVAMVDEINRSGGKAWVGTTWMDYGAGIKWETLLYHHKGLDMDVQALDPRDFRELNDGVISKERIQEIITSAIK